MEMEDKYNKNKGNAGLEGVEFQVNLLTVVLLNALRKHKNWRLSSENRDAAKFDDLVLELSDGSAILLQAKFKDNKKITRDQLLSCNSKSADFSLPKYFFSYQSIKTKFNVKWVIICTNTGVNEKGLEDVINRHFVDYDSVLHYQGGNCSFFTFNRNILPDLQVNAEQYHKNNLQGKIDKSVVTEENAEDFVEHLQFVFNYPSGEKLSKVTEQLLSCLNHSYVSSKISSKDIYKKVQDWFKQPHGEYLTEALAKAMFYEIKSDKYCEALKSYNVFFQNNDLNFTTSKKIFQITTEGGCLMQMLKILHALQKDESKKLFVDPDDESDVQQQAVEAFELRRYVYLIMVWTKLDTRLMEELSCKLRYICEKHSYKKVILIIELNKPLTQHTGVSNSDCDVIDGSMTVEDLSEDTQERLSNKKIIIYQGKRIALKELLAGHTVKDYAQAINLEMLQRLIREEEIKVGTQLLYLDENTTRCYINRRLEKEIIRRDENLESNYPGRVLSLNIDASQCPTDEESCNETEEEVFPEEDIYDVNAKVVLLKDAAGAGKSTVLTKIAANLKEKNPHLWVIKVELNEYTEILKDYLRRSKETISIRELLNSKDTTRLTNQLEEFVFSKEKKVVLILDGIDEISPDYTQLILNLLCECLQTPNFAKIFVVTRPHLTEELEAVLKVNSFVLQPFTDEDQIDFLTSYWAYNLEIMNDQAKKKCRQYAKALMRQMSELQHYNESPFAAIPLHVRMLAEIFQENIGYNEPQEWKGCKEYLSGDEVEPKFTEKLNITKLYDMFIEKKRNAFIDKGSPSGNTAANKALLEQFDDCLVHHRNLALELVLNKTARDLFSCCKCDKDVEVMLLKIGIVQKLDGKLHFIHRTFAEYFVAQSLLIELQQNRNLEFQRLLIDSVLLVQELNVTRAFFNSFLQKIVDSLPSNIFHSYQSSAYNGNLKNWIFQTKLVHVLAEEGCLAILQLILRCVDFKIIKDKEINITYINEGHINKNIAMLLFDRVFRFRANIKTCRSNTLNILRRLTMCGGINIRDTKGRTPLHFAARGGHLEMVKFLIEGGANINSVDNYTFTALDLAIFGGKWDAVKFFVESGADINLKQCNGRTPLHLAAKWGHLDTVKLLVKCGADVDIVNNYGKTPLLLAAWDGHLDIVKFLVEFGADANIKEVTGITALHLATWEGHWNVAKYLVEQGADVRIRGSEAFTVLHLAALGRDLDIVKFFVGHGGDVNVVDNKGCTALHFAASKGQLDIVRYLAGLVDDVNIMDSKGRTALDYAAFKSHLDTVKFLEGWEGCYK